MHVFLKLQLPFPAICLLFPPCCWPFLCQFALLLHHGMQPGFKLKELFSCCSAIIGEEIRAAKMLARRMMTAAESPASVLIWSAGSVPLPMPEQAVCQIRRHAKLAALHLPADDLAPSPAAPGPVSTAPTWNLPGIVQLPCNVQSCRVIPPLQACNSLQARVFAWRTCRPHPVDSGSRTAHQHLNCVQCCKDALSQSF